MKEVRIILLNTKSREKQIVSFLEELKEFLCKDNFDINTDFLLIKTQKPDDEEHSTPYTLLDLDYDAFDVIERLKELTISEYSETLIDKDDLNPPLLFVFGKDINRKTVYIKVKIKGENKKRIICVSFHYAKDPMTFPFA